MDYTQESGARLLTEGPHAGKFRVVVTLYLDDAESDLWGATKARLQLASEEAPYVLSSQRGSYKGMFHKVDQFDPARTVCSKGITSIWKRRFEGPPPGHITCVTCFGYTYEAF